jgi:hypothetical protein
LSSASKAAYRGDSVQPDLGIMPMPRHCRSVTVNTSASACCAVLPSALTARG